MKYKRVAMSMLECRGFNSCAGVFRKNTIREEDTMNHTAGIYLYDDVEALDFTRPFEVSRRQGECN